jgi:hypothetical protein
MPTFSILLGHHPDIVKNLSRPIRTPVLEALSLPPELLTVHYVGVPLASQIERSNGGRYKALAKLGPNDGLTLLADELLSGGVTLTDLGLDHYFKDPHIDRKTIALARVVMDKLGEQAEAGFPLNAPRP